MNNRKRGICLLLLLCLLAPAWAAAEGSGQTVAEAHDGIYSIFDTQGQLVTRVCESCSVGDEYISGDNRHYRVTEVNEAGKTAIAEDLGVAEMPDVSWLSMERTMPVSAAGKERKIALYCTHSDESYEEGDGKSSDEERGGIYDVAAKFAANLDELGVTVDFSKETHHPHDAGAYRRSRQTAVSLLKKMPDAIFDIHRDGIPDPNEYAVTIGNEKMSKIRLLVGRSNQNMEANLSFAKQIKAVADKVYPKLIKDIYMGKGSYNQDLAPRSVLLEMGTHTIAKERVMRSMPPLSEVVYKAMYGGITGAAGASDVSPADAEKEAGAGATATAVPASENNEGSSSGIIWLIVALVVGLLIFAFLAGGGKGGMNKFKRSFSEMSGGLFGKKPPEE